MERRLKKILGLIVVMAFSAILGVGNKAQAATTKNFKGNLNATYKNSEWKSKITIKKVNSKKVSIKIVLDNNWTQGTWNGKVISKDTIQFTLDGGEKIKLKWKDKTHFTAKRPKGGFSGESVQMARRLCFSLNNTKYTQVKKSSTVYYGANHIKRKDTDKWGVVRKITLKKNKIITTGSFRKASKESTLNNGKGTYCKNKKRTFKLASNVKFYVWEGFDKIKLSKRDYTSLCKNANGLFVILKVKNGKVVSVTFSS